MVQMCVQARTKKFYESCRKECGAHLTYNAFWEVQNFCVQQMLPRDGMHAIDLGAIIRLILAILRKFKKICKKICNQYVKSYAKYAQYVIEINMQNMHNNMQINMQNM